MSRVFNFSAGPAVLPASVLRQAAEEMLDWHGQGCGVMEMSHRGEAFTSIIDTAECDLRELLDVPSNYRILFLQGGATQQFAQIPMNLLRGGSADYCVTGAWSEKALREAQRVAPALGGRVRVAATTESSGFTHWLRALEPDPDAAYRHICTNETVHGVEAQDLQVLPDDGVPLIADMSSHILSRPVDVSRFGLIYAGAQKNVGPSGLVIVIVREDLLGNAWTGTPRVMDYQAQAQSSSLLNTPATYSIYVAGLVFKWLKAQGGVTEIERRNMEKARCLYEFIDGSACYRNDVARDSRSRMNVPFSLVDASLNERFVSEAAAARLLHLQGHKSVGGMRASIYNAMPLEGVHALIDFMSDFATRHMADSSREKSQ